MSSPAHYHSNSPILSLEDKRRNYLTHRLQDQVLSDRANYYNVENSQTIAENSRLRRDNQFLNRSCHRNSQALLHELEIKQGEINNLKRDMKLLSESYERDAKTLKVENDNLKRVIRLMEQKHREEHLTLQGKYATISHNEYIRSQETYANDINKLLNDYEVQRLLLEDKQRELEHMAELCRGSSTEYSSNLENLIGENNLLRNKIMQFELNKSQEIQSIESQKELEKSRAKGIISYCRQSNIFIEKEIHNLAQQLLEKTISIESFTKELMKQKRIFEQTQKKNQDHIERMEESHREALAEKDSQTAKLEKRFQEDIAQQKKTEMELLERVAHKEHENDTISRQLNYMKNQLQKKEQQIIQLKENLNKMHEEHVRDISKVMSESKVKRKSMRNVSSVSSFEDIKEGQGSSLIKSGGGLKRQNSFSNQGSSGLPVVREQLATSQMQDEEEEDLQLKQLVLHYEGIIEEIKKSKAMELDIANGKIQAMKEKLHVKQQELYDVLNRFTPLVEFKMQQGPIEEERKQRMKEHYKADISILEVMLDKYKIVALNR